jgi:hypothetical protein
MTADQEGAMLRISPPAREGARVSTSSFDLGIHGLWLTRRLGGEALDRRLVGAGVAEEDVVGHRLSPDFLELTGEVALQPRGRSRESSQRDLGAADFCRELVHLNRERSDRIRECGD